MWGGVLYYEGEVEVKKTVIVTIEKEIDLDIPDELLTEEHLEEFSSYMFPVDSVEDLFEHAGQYVARLDQFFVEGIDHVGVYCIS